MSTVRHIAVVDDDREVRGLLTQFLEKHGFRVTAVPDGRSLRRVMSTQRVDLVVLDVMLPDGRMASRSAGASAPKAQVPIIMLTGKSDDVDRIIGLEIGADDYLAKPFNPARAARASAQCAPALGPRAPQARSDGVSRYRFCGLDAGYGRA